MARLDTDYSSVADLLDGNRKYVVPRYQRAYSWGRVQLTELWEDVLVRYGNLRDSSEIPDTHFLGALVTGQGVSASPLAATPFVIIDGQQRLTSLTILIAAIRDAIVPDADDRAEISGRYLLNITRSGQVHSTKVEPGAGDKPHYRSVVELGEAAPLDHPVGRAYDYFRRKVLAGWAGDVRNEDDGANHEIADGNISPARFEWQILLEAVTQRLELVTISGVTPENAYNVFRTLNSTGLELEQVDLLRNAFFMLLPERAEDVHERLWLPIERRLDPVELKRFFHANLIRLGHNVPEKQIYHAQMLRLKSRGLNEAAVTRELEVLESASRVFVALLRPNSPEAASLNLSAGIAETLSRLTSWGVAPAMPVFLDAGIALDSGRISRQEFERVIAIVESVLVRRHLVNTPPNDLRSVFGRVMRSLSSTSSVDYVAALEDELSEDYVRWPTDRELERAVNTNPFYRGKQKQEFHILRAMAEAMDGREHPHIALSNTRDGFSMEHVLPQTLNNDWEAELTRTGAHNVLEEHRELRNLLGNITLTAYNSNLSNHPFMYKRAYMQENGRLELNRDVIEAEAWGRARIEERGRHLAAVAAKLWPAPKE